MKSKDIRYDDNEPMPVVLKILVLALLALQVYFAWSMISEYISVGISGYTEGYRFGEKGNPWLFMDQNRYSLIMLLGGMLYVALIAITVTMAYLKKEITLLILIFITVLKVLITLYVGFFPWSKGAPDPVV